MLDRFLLMPPVSMLAATLNFWTAGSTLVPNASHAWNIFIPVAAFIGDLERSYICCLPSSFTHDSLSQLSECFFLKHSTDVDTL
jgi:hypothetical protein